jgi:hypothetical protein
MINDPNPAEVTQAQIDSELDALVTYESQMFTWEDFPEYPDLADDHF